MRYKQMLLLMSSAVKTKKMPVSLFPVYGTDNFLTWENSVPLEMLCQDKAGHGGLMQAPGM